MGYNAVLVVLNDRLDEIERDPEFGRKVAAAIRYQGAYDETGAPGRSKPYVTGQTQVISVAHADVTQVVAVGANCGRVIGRGFWRQDDDELIKALEAQRCERAKKAKAEAKVLSES